MSDASPITVAIANDYPVIVEGLTAMLSSDPRLRVEELDSLLGVRSAVDILLVDTFAAEGREAELRAFVANPAIGRVVLYSWNVEPQQVQAALDLGVSGHVSKATSAAELAEALVTIHQGETVVASTQPVAEREQSHGWPGREHGLSARESEIICLIGQGATNEQIARSCYLSINSVKSYIRSAYRKMGVVRRSQAVLWAVEHGMRLVPQRDGAPRQ